MKDSGRIDDYSRRLVPWLLKHRRAVLLTTLLIAVVGVVGAVQLYRDLRSGVEELLPENAMSVRAARIVSPKMHSQNRLSIIMRGSDPDAIERFADDLNARLKALPPTLVDSVEYRVDDQDKFGRQFGLLYLDTPDLLSIRDKLSARIAWEREHANPLRLDMEDDRPAPAVDFKELETKYGDRLKGAVEFRKGYYQTPAGNILVMHVRPPETSTGMGANGLVVDAVKKEIAALNPSSYDPKLEIGYSGEVIELVEEQAALMADLASSTVIVLVFVLGSLWLYFRRWGAIAAVFGPLLAACSVTFGVAYLMVGHLNANTAFLGSIVIGNGINVGIIYVARYMEERRARQPVDEALRVAWATTLPATFVAAFGAGLAYLSLATTDFRGFSQFGAIGAVGMALCWLTVYLVLPPMMSVIEGWRPISPGRPLRPGHGVGRLTDLVERHPSFFRGVSIALVGVFIFGVATYKGDVIEYQLTALRSKMSAKTGAQYWSKVGDEVFRQYLTPVVLWGETPGDLDRTLKALDAQRKAEGSNDPFRDIQSLSTLIPANQDRKIPIITEIRDMLTDGRMKKIAPDMRKSVERIRPTGDIVPVTLENLPAAVRRAMVEKDGTTGRVALCFPNAPNGLDLHDADKLKSFIERAIGTANSKVLILSPMILLADIGQAIWHDGPQATLLAFVLVCILVVFVMRRVKSSLLVIGALVMGLVGLVGIAALANIRVNFMNFVVLPITFGIGVDYAVNIVQRYRREGIQALGRILHETGGAVALCSATTVIGYGSLMVADNKALSGFGMLAAIGEITCLSTALLLMPAWLFPRRPASSAESAVETSEPITGAS
jgi:predicted RND superfamily exporter protein